MKKSPIWVAVDATDIKRALAIAQACAPYVLGIKLGLEFYLFHGRKGVEKLAAESGLPVFLDLKLHDIPNTVGKAIAGLTGVPATLLTIHAAGGKAMIAAARAASEHMAEGNHGLRPKIIAVTVLTSLDTEDIQMMGVMDPPQMQAVRLAKLAQDAGADGVVCSSHEITAIRAACGKDFYLVVPGIRQAGDEVSDQKRTMTAREAIALGATQLVIGRPITEAPDMAMAAKGFSQDILSAG